MKTLPQKIRERMPVWIALSDLFLDTTIEDDDCASIARRLSASPYSETEIWEILRYEVYPACIGNLLCVAGEWALFPEEWLMEHVAPRCDKRPRFVWPMWHFKLISEDWEKVRKLIAESPTAI